MRKQISQDTGLDVKPRGKVARHNTLPIQSLNSDADAIIHLVSVYHHGSGVCAAELSNEEHK